MFVIQTGPVSPLIRMMDYRSLRKRAELCAIVAHMGQLFSTVSRLTTPQEHTQLVNYVAQHNAQLRNWPININNKKDLPPLNFLFFQDTHLGSVCLFVFLSMCFMSSEFIIHSHNI
ncbi:hypothetical protein GOODEAATRI_031112 [Goodea atripinnis]|uniref:Uncharacterized protein n=1 Tax=Goodea atripinnis TaxID=208336 RepID=A0ABV0N5P5_9TELE